MIHSDDIAIHAVDYLAVCTDLAPDETRANLCDTAVRRVISALFDGNTGRLAAWYRMHLDRSRPESELADILHAACHAVAYGFERDDPARLPDALGALDLIECEIDPASRGRVCCHDHRLGISPVFRLTA